MKQQKDLLSPEEEKKAFRAMQKRMRNYAFHHVDSIGPSTLVALQNLDLFEEPVEDPLGAGIELEVLQNPEHPRRVPIPPGPLLLHITKDQESNRTLIEIPILLLSEFQALRIAALGELERLIKSGQMEITPKTIKIIEHYRGHLQSSNPADWRPAAIALTDALGDDVLIALQGVRQCLACKPTIQQYLNIYATRILHPSVSSLETINLDSRNPANEHPRLVEIITSIVSEASNLRDACAQYHCRLGYIPLAPTYSMARVVSDWLNKHPESEVWGEVWAWAKETRGPIPRYHACTVFVLHPELVPEGKRPELWSEVLNIMRTSIKETDENMEVEPWALRRDLARHYAFHLEAHLPDKDGAAIACFAWWFAEKVASIFPDEPKSAKFYRENWVQKAKDRSEHIWLAASPHIERSYLRYVTATIKAPWATALLAVMAGKLDKMDPGSLTSEMQSLFHEALASNLVGALPFVVEPATDPTFAQECPIGQTALEWAKHQPDDQRVAMEQLVVMNRTFSSPSELCNDLRKLNERSLPDQIAITLALKAKAYTDPAIADPVWDVITDSEWRQRVFNSLEERVLALLVECLNLLQADNVGKWFTHLPHFLADSCEKTEDKDRCRHLFLCTLLTSLTSDTVSAIHRLLHGSKKAWMAEFAEEYHSQVEAAWSQYPPWVQGRLRALLASLSVAV